jgi:hypothetical protein
MVGQFKEGIIFCDYGSWLEPIKDRVQFILLLLILLYYIIVFLYQLTNVFFQGLGFKP